MLLGASWILPLSAVHSMDTAMVEAELENMEWRLAAINADELPVPENIEITIRLSAGRVNGKAACNSYFGEYSLAPDHQLKFSGNLGATMMACPPPVEEWERRYLQVLPEVASYRFQEEYLLLLGKEKETLLRFRMHQPPSLESTRWQAVGINNGRGGVVSSAITPRVLLRFAEGRLTGNGGCNRLQGIYRARDGVIAIEQLALTRMHCNEPKGLMAQEQQLMDALARASVFEIRSDHLEIRDAAGALLIRLVPKP